MYDLNKLATIAADEDFVTEVRDVVAAVLPHATATARDLGPLLSYGPETSGSLLRIKQAWKAADELDATTIARLVSIEQRLETAVS
jgi:hypothetical protein